MEKSLSPTITTHSYIVYKYTLRMTIHTTLEELQVFHVNIATVIKSCKLTIFMGNSVAFLIKASYIYNLYTQRILKISGKVESEEPYALS